MEKLIQRYGVDKEMTPEQLGWADCTHYIGKGIPTNEESDWKIVKVRPRPITPEQRAIVHLPEYR